MNQNSSNQSSTQSTSNTAGNKAALNKHPFSAKYATELQTHFIHARSAIVPFAGAPSITAVNDQVFLDISASPMLLHVGALSYPFTCHIRDHEELYPKSEPDSDHARIKMAVGLALAAQLGTDVLWGGMFLSSADIKRATEQGDDAVNHSLATAVAIRSEDINYEPNEHVSDDSVGTWSTVGYLDIVVSPDTWQRAASVVTMQAKRIEVIEAQKLVDIAASHGEIGELAGSAIAKAVAAAKSALSTQQNTQQGD